MDKESAIMIILDHIKNEYLDDEDQQGFDKSTPLITSGLIDSITILQVVDFLEEQFKIEFEPHEVDQVNLNSVDLIVDFVQRKLISL